MLISGLTTERKLFWLKWLNFFILAFIWGSAFILIKKGLEVYSPLQVATLRLAISGLVLFPFLIYYMVKLKKNKIKLKYFFLQGLLGSAIPALLIAHGQMVVPSGLTGILVSSQPFFALIFSFFLFKATFSFGAFGGIILGILGVVFLMWPEIGKDVNEFNSVFSFSCLLIIIASATRGLSTNLVKLHFKGVSPIEISSISIGIFLLPSALYLFNSDFLLLLTHHEKGVEAFLAIALLALLSTTVAVVILYQLIKNSDAVFASSVTYIIPVVAILWGYLDGEIIRVSHFIGMSIIFVGLFIIEKNRLSSKKNIE